MYVSHMYYSPYSFNVHGGGAHMRPLDDELAVRFDHAVLRLRRLMFNPQLINLPLPSAGKRVDFAKFVACAAIEELGFVQSSNVSITVKDVATHMGLEHSTTSRLLGDLEAEGLIARSTDPSDRRRTIVTLTDLGHQVVSEEVEMRKWATSAIFEDWSLEEVEQLTASMERLADSFNAKMPAIVSEAKRRIDAVNP
jgi:DNA-binding MarR family transcriptional regulator